MMSSADHTPPVTTSTSTDSFVDASDGANLVSPAEVDDKDTLKEEPLATPNHSMIQSNGDEANLNQEEKEEKANVVTIFDVATEIETMLKEIDLKIDENDQLVQQKIEKINKTLDKIEHKVKTKHP